MAQEKSYKYIIIGGGISGGYAAREFTNQGLKPGELAIISKEPVPPYERTEFARAITDFETNPTLAKNYVCSATGGDRQYPQWYKDQGIDLILSTEIVKADLASKTLVSDDGTIFKYQTLLIATGSANVRLSEFGIEEADVKNLFYVRDVEDTDEFVFTLESYTKGGKVVVIGGGYLGFEMSASLRFHNFEVTLIFPEPWIMHKLFTPEMASFYESHYAKKGIKIIKGSHVTGFNTDSNGQVTEVKLDDGTTVEADIVLAGVGAKPVTSFFKGQLDQDKNGGIKTDGFFKTSDPDVYALGDIATYPMKIYGDQLMRVEHGDNARKSAVHAVKAIAAAEKGETIPAYDYLPYSYSRVLDISWEFYGDNVGETVLFGDIDPESPKAKFGTYWVKDGKVFGVFLEGGTPEENKAIAKVARAQPSVESLDVLSKEGLSFATNFYNNTL